MEKDDKMELNRLVVVFLTLEPGGWMDFGISSELERLLLNKMRHNMKLQCPQQILLQNSYDQEPPFFTEVRKTP